MKNYQALFLYLLLILSSFACSSSRSYYPTAKYSEGDLRNINDEDILKAFEAEPQLQLPTKIAWYNMSYDSLVFKLQMPENKQILENYLLPKSLIEGIDPLFPSQYQSYYSQPIDFKAIRLLAARAKCDLVVLVSSRFGEQQEWNIWSTFNLLILPAFFTPHIDSEYRYSAEVFVFDVRNAFMYTHLKYSDTKKSTKLTASQAPKNSKSVNENMINEATAYFKTELQKLFASNQIN